MQSTSSAIGGHFLMNNFKFRATFKTIERKGQIKEKLPLIFYFYRTFIKRQ